MLRRFCRRVGSSVGAVVVLAGSSEAQQATPSPGSGDVDVWVVEAHLKTRTSNWHAPDPRGPISYVRVRTMQRGAQTRMDFLPDSSAGWDFPGLGVGLGILTTIGDTSVTVVGVDSSQKQWMPFRLGANFYGSPLFFVYRDPASDTLDTVSPHDPRLRVDDVSVTVDRVGDGPTLLGHPTVRYRQTQRAALRGDYDTLMTTVVRTISVLDVDVATDVTDAPPVDPFGVLRAAETNLGLTMTANVAPALRAAAAKYPRGVVLHIEGTIANGSNDGSVTRLMDVTVDKFEHRRVSAAVFTVPPNFKRGAFQLP